jgi:hypothetical protein
MYKIQAGNRIAQRIDQPYLNGERFTWNKFSDCINLERVLFDVSLANSFKSFRTAHNPFRWIARKYDCQQEESNTVNNYNLNPGVTHQTSV